MKQFHDYLQRQGAPRFAFHACEVALGMMKDPDNPLHSKGGWDRPSGIVDTDGEEVTLGQLRDAYRIDRYVERTGDGPESLKDMMRF